MRRLPADVRLGAPVHPHPLERVVVRERPRQTVDIGDGSQSRDEDRAHPRSAGDRWLAGGGGVGAKALDRDAQRRCRREPIAGVGIPPVARTSQAPIARTPRILRDRVRPPDAKGSVHRLHHHEIGRTWREGRPRRRGERDEAVVDVLARPGVGQHVHATARIIARYGVNAHLRHIHPADVAQVQLDRTQRIPARFLARRELLCV